MASPVRGSIFPWPQRENPVAWKYPYVFLLEVTFYNVKLVTSSKWPFHPTQLKSDCATGWWCCCCCCCCFFKGDILCHQMWVQLAVTSRFENLLLWHHKWVCTPRCVLGRSVYQPSQWTVANVAHLFVIHLGGLATCDVRRGRFSTRFVTANHTHTCWYNMSP